MSSSEAKRKPNKKKIIAAVVGGVAVLALVAGGMALASHAKQDAAEAEGIVTETVEAGDITQSVSGTGSLVAEKTVNVLVPADLMVEKVLVAQGDEVQVGTPIATVSAESVRAKLLAIEENIDTLQKQLDDLSPSTEHYDLKKSVLQDQIADLKYDRDAMLGLQETLTLTSDTAGVVGSVSLNAGTLTGQTSLREQKGDSQKGDDGSAEKSDVGAELAGQYAAMDADEAAVATDTADYTAPRPSVAMTAAYRVPCFASQPANALVVPCAGNAPAAEGAEEADELDLQPMADESPDQADANDASGNQPAEEGGSGEGGDANGGDAPEGSGGDSQDGPVQPDPSAPTAIRGKVVLEVAPPVTGAVPQDTPGIAQDVTQFTGEITWVPAHDAFAPQTEYAAIIYLTAADGFCFVSVPGELDVSVTGSSDQDSQLFDLDGDGFAETCKITAYFPETEAAATEPKDDAGESQLSDGNLGDLGGFSFGGGYGSDDSSGSLTKQGASYSDTEAVALSVTPNSKTFLDIQVDELDVNQIEVGQQATVTIDALDGEQFTGTISQIANTAQGSTQEGGSVKYTARIDLPQDDRMRYGMSAKAEIIVNQVSDAILVPIDAISDVDGKSVVYTSVDDEGVLGSPVEVTTGLSDGSRVQVIEGLSVGDTICYVPTIEGDDDMYYY